MGKLREHTYVRYLKSRCSDGQTVNFLRNVLSLVSYALSRDVPEERELSDWNHTYEYVEALVDLLDMKIETMLDVLTFVLI